MSEGFEVSVVISTYNRCDTLPAALESVCGQEADGVRYEVIVVDNNSTDRTREVVESFMSRSAAEVKYIFEGRQGLSHGRNSGVACARAPIIAFTDDDVRANSDWVASIKRAFDEHPEVDFLGGKVLPRWGCPKPSWLTREIWDGPLALVDCGERSFYSNARSPVFFPGANFSFRREVFGRIGAFDPNFQQVKGWVSSTEDSELILRLWRAGGQGLYDPRVVVTADVQVERMRKQYFRRWHASRGRYNAMLRLHEIIGADGLRGPGGEGGLLTLFGTPAYVYRELLASAGRSAAAALRGRQTQALKHECQVRQMVNYIGKRYVDWAAEGKRAPLTEAASFAAALMRKKARRQDPQ